MFDFYQVRYRIAAGARRARRRTLRARGVAHLTVSLSHPLLPRGADGDKIANVPALGHKNPQGGGPANAFGLAFKVADLTWTPAFCAADTDGDGQTNGFELGDPCCTWVVDGPPPFFTADLSNPADASSMSSRKPDDCATPSASPSPPPVAAPSPSATPIAAYEENKPEAVAAMAVGAGAAAALAVVVAVAVVRRQSAAAALARRGAAPPSLNSAAGDAGKGAALLSLNYAAGGGADADMP